MTVVLNICRNRIQNAGGSPGASLRRLTVDLPDKLRQEKRPASGQWRKKFVGRWRAANKKPGKAGLFSNTGAKNPYPWRAFIRGFFLLIT